MAICKCKMCGGDLNITELDKVVECEYCGTTQTVPSADNEKKMTLFNRANRLRSNNEFDKAAALYEQLVAEFPEEAEAYWGLCLCNYGIEYVDDPATGKKIPTCHRASFEKLSADENFSLAMEYADVIAQRQYRMEAREIDRINEEILSVSRNETPYDIFICYKETDENGNRTVDSVMAQDIYDALTAKGYKVFFSRISLEDKLGQQYEPYIFAALNSAKIMLSVGTKYEYFHAVWVKNEWSRFLRLAAKDKSKVLIPCYKDMDPFDMPDEFQALQAQDLGKLGAIQDLVRGMEKLLGKDSQSITVVNPSNAGALTKRGYIFLEDMDFSSADSYFDRALDENPEDPKAYLGKTLCRLKITCADEMNDVIFDPDSIKDFGRAIRFSPEEEKNKFLSIFESAKKKYYIKCFSSIVARIARKKENEERRLEAEKRKAEEERLLEEQKKEAERQAQNELERLVEFRRKISGLQNRIAVGYNASYGINIDGTVVAVGVDDNKRREIEKWRNIKAVIPSKCGFVFGLCEDGTVKVAGTDEHGRTNVKEWSDIVEIATEWYHTFGLKSDGTVVATQYIGDGKDTWLEDKALQKSTSVSSWRDIVDIKADYSVGTSYIVGLKKDGKIVGVKCEKKWKSAYGRVDNYLDYTKIECPNREFKSLALYEHKIGGILKDGTAYGCPWDEGYRWKDIDSIIYAWNMLGLKADGSIVCPSKGFNRALQPKTFSGWNQVACFALGGNYSEPYVIGLRADGTVIAVGSNKNGECDVEGWNNIIAISAGETHTIGLRSDGTVVSTGGSDKYKAELRKLNKWKLFNNYETIKEERAIEKKREEEKYIAAQKRAAEEREKERKKKITGLSKEKADLEAELPTLKGLFKGSRRKEVEARLTEIEAELKKLQS